MVRNHSVTCNTSATLHITQQFSLLDRAAIAGMVEGAPAEKLSMKVGHFPVVLRHNPWFVLRHGPRMLAHTFRPCRLKTLLRLEDERPAFRRYRNLRQRERNYL